MTEKKSKYSLRKTTLVNSKFVRWTWKGKGTKELRELVDELRGVVRVLHSRLKRHRYVMGLLNQQLVDKEKEYKQLTKQQVEEAIRATKLEATEKQKLRTKRHEYKLRLLNTKIANRDRRVNELTEEVKKLKREVSNGSRREETLKRKFEGERLSHVKLKQVRSKDVKEVTPPNVKKLQNLVSKGFSERGINYLDLSSKLSHKLDEHSITAMQYSVLLQVQMSGNLNTRDLIVGNKLHMAALREKGLINKTLIGSVTEGWGWFLTTRGEEIVNDINNWLSYSKSLIK